MVYTCFILADDCRMKEYGCCPDDKTPAQGLHYEGCPGKWLYS